MAGRKATFPACVRSPSLQRFFVAMPGPSAFLPVLPSRLVSFPAAYHSRVIRITRDDVGWTEGDVRLTNLRKVFLAAARAQPRRPDAVIRRRIGGAAAAHFENTRHGDEALNPHGGAANSFS